ncbi:MAG TPA: LacI family transcriptional regulator [Firmicutes bacterium]|jgi:LacI family transcriptional regulator|nr:LacI family transcriptional regulator [Bacillota bacterium]HBT15707.1 LacI family transcriptional regulator [Bacillota bacterium]
MKMQDIADLAGVSIATVSRVINQPEKVKIETRLKVQKILEQTNFVANAVARGLVVNSMKTIGVLTVDIRDLYFSNIIYTIERQFTDLGYNVILSNTGGELGEKKKYLLVMLEKQVDGLILVGSVFKERSGNKHILEASKNVPVILVNSFLEGDNIYSVLCDDAYGVKEAVNYLVNQGRKDIYYFTDTKSASGLAKLEGFVLGMKENGLNETNIIEVSRDLEGGIKGSEQLVADNRKVSAVICGEDLIAIGAMKAFTGLGRKIPDDVGFIGYNNSILAQTATPTLTSVDNMAAAMARQAVELLVDTLQHKQVSKKIVLTPSLLVRESTNLSSK